MFIADELCLQIGFAAASTRLAVLADGHHLLQQASQDAYADAVGRLARLQPAAGPPAGAGRGRPGGPAQAGAALSAVRTRRVTERGLQSVLVLRWEADGPGCEPVPVLDADITLAPAGPDSTLCALAGAYRPPLSLVAPLDPASVRLAAAPMTRRFLNRIAAALSHPAGMAEGAGLCSGGR